MLNTLNDFLQKKGEKWVDKFLSEEIIITEKLDTFRILFEKRNDKLVFFKKDNTELNLIERVLTNIWEDSIIEISVMLNEIEIPEGMRFGISYTPIERPLRIPYTNLPKYILTDISKRDPKSDKVIETYEYDEVTQWATIFNMGRPPILFEGKLSEEQKNMLLKYANKDYDDVFNFAEFIKEQFGETYSGENIIEGIIIKNGKNLAQITSYEFNILNEAYQKIENSRDFYDLIILSINSFMDQYIDMPIFEGATSDEIYLEIISDIFNKYCNSNFLPENLEPKYLTPPSFGYVGDLNLLLIKNKETINILEKGNKLHESLFKIMLSSLKKPKKSYGLINETAANKFNTYVFLIENIINAKLKDTNDIIDDYIQELNEKNSENVVIDAVNKRKNTDIDNMRVIASIQKVFEPEHEDVKKGKEEVVIYVTKCQPFTTSQMENILAINRTWKLPVIIASVSNNRKIKGEKFNFSDELLKAQLQSIQIFNKDIIPAFMLLDNWSLSDIFYYCRPKFEPIALLTDKGIKADFVVQLYFEDKVMGGRLGVNEKFNIGEMENKYNLEAYRAIEDNLFVTFREVTPQSIHGLYDSMIAEYKTWSGQLIGII